MNILRGISIVLLLFAYNANAKEVVTHKVCDMGENSYTYRLSLERCPGLKKGDVLTRMSSYEAPFYCHTSSAIITTSDDRVYCRYNGVTILQEEDITDKVKGKLIKTYDLQ